MYTDGNAARQIARADDGTLWAATGGGAVSWDLESGEATVYTVLDGLPANDLHAIVVCPIPEPRVIFGGDEGLALYDPTSGSWEQWNAENSELESNEVGALNCDADSNTLLITYDWGVGTFDAATGEWRHFTTDDGLASDWANQMLVVDGEIWVTSDSGVSVIHTDGNITIYDEETSDIADERVEAIAADADGTIWLAGSDGLLKFQDGAWTQYTDDNVEEFPFLDAFEDVLAAPDGMIWAGNGFGEICQFDPAAETCLEIYDSEEGMVDDLNALLLDDQGILTYCGDEGISTFDGGGWRTLALDGQAASNVYDTITQTPDGTIWVGGYFGLQRFPAEDPDGVWEHDEMGGHRVSTFHLGQEGLWIGHGGGATYAEYAQLQQRDAWTQFEAVNEPGEGVYGGVVAITEDGSGRVWFGGSGLTVWDGETYTYHDLLTDEERADEDSPGFAHGLLYDGTGVWVSTWGRLLYFDENDEVIMWDQLPVGGTPYVESMALDADGQVLLADANRVLSYDGGTFTEWAELGDTVMSIFVGETGEIWLGLEDQGVSHYDGSEWSTMTTADGLPTNQFSDESILVDNLGAVWFAGRTGGLASRSGGPLDDGGIGVGESQWAISATASSEYGNPDWAATQATGAPDTVECGDHPTAWASAGSDTIEWIELTYNFPVLPTQVNIIQTHSPNQVVKVELIDPMGTQYEIYTGEPEDRGEECPYTLSIPVEDARYQVDVVRITIDQTVISDPWNEIDAVELVGVPEHPIMLDD